MKSRRKRLWDNLGGRRSKQTLLNLKGKGKKEVITTRGIRRTGPNFVERTRRGAVLVV